MVATLVASPDGPQRPRKEEIIEAIRNLSVMDLVWLVKELKTAFGITDVQLVSVPGPVTNTMTNTEKQPEPKEEQTEFRVVLQEVGPLKINVIKAVRELIVPLGLMEAKQLVERAPVAIKEGVSREEANKIKEKLEAAGATVKIE